MVYDPAEWNHKDPTRLERVLDALGDAWAFAKARAADVWDGAHPNYWGLLGLTLVLTGCARWAA